MSNPRLNINSPKVWTLKDFNWLTKQNKQTSIFNFIMANQTPDKRLTTVFANTGKIKARPLLKISDYNPTNYIDSIRSQNSHKIFPLISAVKELHKLDNLARRNQSLLTGLLIDHKYPYTARNQIESNNHLRFEIMQRQNTIKKSRDYQAEKELYREILS